MVSGATAIPLNRELNLLADWFGLAGQSSAAATSEAGRWLLTAREALQEVSAKYPLLFYGTDPAFTGKNTRSDGRQVGAV